MKTIAIHQPNYIPWIGYFYKIWASDLFIIHDNIEYSKHSLTKRVFIREAYASLEKTYLTVPIKKHSDFSKIKDLKISFEHDWQKKHLNKIYNTYHNAPYFETYHPIIKEAIENAVSCIYLYEFNVLLIKEVLKILNINKLIFLSSELPPFKTKADALNAEMVEYLGGNIYLSGQGAKKYQTEFVYNAKGIQLEYNSIGYYLNATPPSYPVLFNSSFSILDALFFLGKKGIIDLFEAYYAFKKECILV